MEGETPVADPPSPDGATDPPSTPDPALTQDDPSPEGTDPTPGLASDKEPPETEGTKSEGPDDSWRKAESVEDVLKHEAFAVPWKDREEAGYKRGRDANEKVLQHINAQNGRIAKINTDSEAFLKKWGIVTEAVAAGTLDSAEAQRFKDDNQEMFNAISGVHQEGGRWEGINSVIQNLADAAGDKDMLTELGQRINDVRTNVVESDPTFYTDLVQRVVDAKTKPLQDEITELKAKAERLEGEVKQAERTADGGPAPEPATGGLSKTTSDRDLLLDPNTPVEKLVEIRARQHAQ